MKKEHYQGRHDASSARKTTRSSHGKKKKPIVALIAAAVVVLALVAGLYVYVSPALKYDTIYPNVYVAGVNVGGMTKVEAKEAVLDAVQDTYGTETLTVTLPDRELSFPPELTKVTLNTDTAIDEAWRYGRTGSVISRAKALRNARMTEYRIDLKTELELDTEAIRALIEKTASSLSSKPIQTKVNLDTENNLLTITAGTSGKTLDVDALYDAVYDRFLNNDFSPMEFAYETVEPDAVDLQDYYDQIGKTAVDAYFDETTGEIVAEEVGYGFDVAAAEQRLARADEGEVLEITLETIEPEVTKAELEETYFCDTLSSYDSPYVWNPNRTNNLVLACKAIDGTVVMPGKEFSFNDTVGERTSEKGYLEATVYVNGASVGETGGGVCQVASTIYYCALYANLEITQREEHMYFVTYVPAALDATVYWGQLDFKFRNNTDYPIRIEASASDGYVHVKLIGTKTNDNYVKMISEQLSQTSWKTVDEQNRELTKASQYGDNVYYCAADGKYYQSVSTVETAYTGSRYITYRNIYKADGTLISSEKEDTSTYNVRNLKLKVTLMDPQPGQTTEPDPEPTVDPEPDTDPEPTPDPEPFDPIPSGDDDDSGDEYWP